MTVSELAGRLNAKQVGDRWMARCPAHDDKRASLSIGPGDDSRVLLHCHAGCATDDVLTAVGLTMADLHERRNGDTPQIVATYDYTDENGALLYQVCRFDPKGFRQRRPDGAGAWAWRLGDVRRVLFGLPELIGRKLAYIAEGEKDVLALRKLGFVATTNAGGAGKWRDEYAEQLRAAGIESVAILPDNDDAGRAHAQAVARSGRSAGIRAKIVMLPDLPVKGDVSDYLETHSRDDLIALIEATALYEPSTVTPATAPTSREFVAAPVLVRLADVQPEDVSYLWPGRIARRKLQLIVGDPGLGKSTITLDIAARVTRAGVWPDGGHAPQGDVILLSAEDGLADTVRPRLDTLGADVGRIHALTAARMPNGDERSISLAGDVALLERAIVNTGATLVIIDPVSAYLGATDSYKDTEVRGVLAPLAALADRTGVAIVGVMHLGKGTQRPALYRALGSVAFVAAARIVLAVAPHPDDDTKRVLAPVKANICAAAATLAYRLDAGGLAWDAEPVAGVDVDALLSSPMDRQERREADEWLRQALADGPRLSREIEAAAEQAGIPRRTLFRAKARLQIEAERIGGLGRGGKWYCNLPGAKSATPEAMAPLDLPLAKPADFSGSGAKSATAHDVAPIAEDEARAGLF